MKRFQTIAMAAVLGTAFTAINQASAQEVAQELGVERWECAALGTVIIKDATPKDFRAKFSDNLVLTFSNGAKANLVGKNVGPNITSWDSPSTGIGFSYSPRPYWKLSIEFSRDIFGYKKRSYPCIWQ